MTRRFFKTLAIAPLALSFVSTGCFFTGYEGAFVERSDVSLDMPNEVTNRSHGGEQGEVYELVTDTARDVNGWVGELVEGIATVVAVLNQHRETRREGDWRVYGPFDDDEGRDLSWLVKISGDAEATAYEVWIGDRSATDDSMDMILSGDIVVDGDIRRGGFTLLFDAAEKHPEIKDAEDAAKQLSGAIEVTFERDVSNDQKTVDIAFKDFREESFLGDAWFSDETYEYHRTPEGAGDFHLAVYGSFDDNAWGGLQVNKLVLDAKWNTDELGRTRGQILEVDNEESGLEHGDLVIHECFEAGGELTYRLINDPYNGVLPGYNLGDEASCVFSEKDLDE